MCIWCALTGVYEPLGPEVIAAWLAKGSAAEICKALVSSAYEAGGRDNITAVVLRVDAA